MTTDVTNVFDYLLPSKASLDIVGANGFSLNVQTFTIPAIYGHTAEQASPMYAIPLPGNKCVMDKLSVSFLVSENLDSWLDLHQWMMGIYQPERTEQFINKKLYLEEIILTTYSSANNALMRVKFHGAFPVILDEISFNVQETSATPVKSKVDFAYMYYTIEKVNSV